MDESVKEMLASLFHFPAEIMVDSVHPSANDLVISVSCSPFPRMPCPDCQKPSCRIQSQDPRTGVDLPRAVRNVILALTVRTSVCGTKDGPHKIKTSRLPELLRQRLRNRV